MQTDGTRFTSPRYQAEVCGCKPMAMLHGANVFTQVSYCMHCLPQVSPRHECNRSAYTARFNNEQNFVSAPS